MLSVDQVLIEASLQLEDNNAWIWLFQIDIGGETLRFARNTEDVIWNGNTWTKFPIDIGDISEGSGDGTIQLGITVSNLDGLIQSYIEPLNGADGSLVNIFLVYAGDLTKTNVPTFTLAIIDSAADTNAVVFKLGSIPALTQKFPLDKMSKIACRHLFKDEFCAYAGGETVCDKTLTRCRALNNSARYGGFVGLGGGPINAQRPGSVRRV